MSSASAQDSFRFALQRELVKLYLAVILGLAILNVSQGVFLIIEHPFIRNLVRLPFILVVWGLVAGGVIGVLHFVLTRTTASPSAR